MTPPSSIVEVLRDRAMGTGPARNYIFLANGEIEAGRMAFADLDLRARAVAARLREGGVGREPVLLLFPSGLDFVAAFCACLYAGAVAVPAYPPGSRRGLGRLHAILEDARPRVVLTTTALAGRVASALPAPSDGGPEVLPVDEVPDGAADGWRDPGSRGDDLAFLQYTSGSTSTPRGVMVTHANLVHNERVIQRAFEQDGSSRVVSWLPLYHDMGLIGAVLQPLFTGADCVLMPPASFLQKPRRWLDAISRYRADTSGGPNFAYELCVDKVPEEEREGLDLSSWRVAFNGAEPVRPGTLRRFARAFAGCGFRSSAMRPCYGLAEATLMVSGGRPAERSGPAALDVDAEALGRGEVRIVGSEGEEREPGAPATLAGSGAVAGAGAGDLDVRIVDPESGVELPAGRVGEIWVAGPSVTAGYWNRPEESAEVFGAVLASAPGRELLRTGDLGFLSGGELFVTGRLKDLLILRGRNHYPQDLERTAERSHPALRPGGGAAFALPVGGEERAVVVHEIERGRDAEAAEAGQALSAAIALEHEVALHDVVLLRRGGLPKTTSGKVRRRACRELWLAGELPVVWSRGEAVDAIAREDGEGGDAELPVLTAEALAAAPAGERRSLLADDLRRRAALLLERPVRSVPMGAPVAALGLDSLRSMELRNAVEEAFGVSLGVAEVLDSADLSDLAGRMLDGLAEGAAAAPTPSPADAPALSSGQRALWFLHRLAPESSAYHLAAAFRIDGSLSREALVRALRALVERHPVLRTEIVEKAGEPVARKRENVEPRLGWIEAREGGEAELRALAAREAWRPFDLADAPLLRASVIDGAAGRVLVLAVHHAVADLWSLALLLGDLERLYREDGELPEPAAPALSYADFAAWQVGMLAGPEGEACWRYWREELGGEQPELALPTDRPRPAAQSFRGAARSRPVSPELAEGLTAVARERGTTLFAGLLAGLGALLHRYTGERDLCVGSPAAGRPSAAWSDVVGYFVNPVVLRTAIEPGATFSGLVEQARDRVVAALRHQDLPFPLLVERLCPDREPSRNPLFQVMLVLHQERLGGRHDLGALAAGVPGGGLRLGSAGLEALPLETESAQVDLSLAVSEVGGGLRLALQYATDLFDGTTAERMLRHLEALLRGAVAEPDRPLGELPLLDAAERAQLLGEWNASPELPAPRPIHDLFAEQAEATPDAVAVTRGGVALSYRELAARSARLARHLSAAGVGPEVPVGVLLDRGPELLVALLGVLRAGGAYVPLDPAYPGSRLAHYLEDSGAPVLVSRSDLAPAVPAGAGGRRVLLDVEAAAIAGLPSRPAESGATSRNLAYVIYTSGSTGRPKGVAIEHRSAAAFLAWAGRHFDAAETGAVLAATSVCFDLSVFEIFAPLVRGGTVVLADSALDLSSDPPRVSLVNTVPSVLAELLRSAPLPASVRTVNLAGEPLPASLVERLGALGTVERLENLYGPSESTTYSTGARIPLLGDERGERPPSIGRPITGTRAYVADPGLALLPAGVPGQLLLGGAGLARGYLGRPALTAERFLPDPFGGEPGGRLYRTGDLCRLRTDGELDFLGRFDHQVKLRGFRIELGEVEAAAERLPEVAEAVALVREDRPGDRRLVLYTVPAPGADRNPGTEALRRALAPALPSFMLPSAWVSLDALPRTPNGKVDRRALPAPSQSATGAGEAPRGATEAWLAGAWRELLGVGAVGREDGFFRLGGHSLLAVRLTARVRDGLGVELPLGDVFAEPTLAGLARRIDALRGSAAGDAIPTVPRDGALPLSFPQQRIHFLHRLAPESPAYHMAGAIRVSGPLDRDALGRAFAEIVRRHEVLRSRFPESGGEPRQLPGRAPVPELLEEAEADLLARLVAEARRPFDLSRDAPLRVRVVRSGEERHAVLVVLHHIAADGWSVEILLRELAELYDAFAAGEPSPLPEPPIQYADFACWQRARLNGPALAEPLAWWREHLAGAPPALDLSLGPAGDGPRPPAASQRGDVRRASLPADTAAALHALGRERGVTPFMTLLAGFGALLGRYAGEDDLLVGSPVANRERPEVQGLIGCFVNLVALRLDLSGVLAFGELLERVRGEAAAVLARREVPFEMLVESLAADGVLSHDPARPPLVQAVLAVEHAPAAPRLPGLAVERLPLDLGTVRFDLTLFATLDGEGGVDLSLEHSSDLFDEAAGERFLGHLSTLLAGAVVDPGRPLASLSLTTGAEERQLLFEWNQTDARVPDGGVTEWVDGWIEGTPDAAAVVAGERVLSYGELGRRADRLARRLAGLGVGPESVVAICSERSPEAVIAALATLRAGAAYLPLDPANPQERLAFMAADAGATVVLLAPGAPESIVPPGVRALPLGSGDATEGTAAVSPAAVSSDTAAYVIYTSGSTGKPKGVVTPHRGLANLVAWHLRTHGLAAGDRASHLAAPGFDAAVWEVWSTLAAGATLYLPEDGVRTVPAELVEWLVRRRIASGFLPTPLAEAVLREPWPADAALATVLTGGDRLRSVPPEGVPFRLVNHYGPTESTVVATACAVEPAGAASGPAGPPPIGLPIDNVRAYVTDGALAPVPVGVAGELVLGGDGLARGYLDAPARTAERFVPDPFGGRADSIGRRLYRTGDRVRRAADGSLRFLGRADRQVKVRGFRIELGEVEAVLRGHPALAEAVARVVERPEAGAAGALLVAYAVPAPGPGRDGDWDALRDDLRRHLAAGLPEYMVPSAFVRLDALPLTRNGKIDRRALPDPDLAIRAARPYVPPGNPVEELLAEVYGELLGVDRVSADDSFFDLGGNSLLAGRLVSRVRDELGIEVPLRDLFEGPTVVELTASLSRIAAAQAASEPAWDDEPDAGAGVLEAVHE